MLRALGAVFLVFLIGGVIASSSDDSGDADRPTHIAGTEDKSERKDDSSLACDHFRNIAGDVANGVLTDAEAREKFQEVRGNALIATPRVRVASTDLVAAMTTGTTKDLLRAMKRMDAACEATGN